MNRKYMLFIILLLVISLLTGCGGGSGGGNDDDKTPIEKGSSSDYFGLEVGAKLVWKVNEVLSNQTWLSTYEVIEEDPHGEFKTKWSYSNEDKIEGEFIKKSPDGSYTEIADWYFDEVTGKEKRNDYEEEDFLVIVKNPIQVGFKSDRWGEALRQENVTVPAGTFKAWVFRDHDQWDDDDRTNYFETSYYWFVPYLGFVKSTSKTTKEGDSEVTESITAVLQSYSF